jgi:hypothetical protein
MTDISPIAKPEDLDYQLAIRAYSNTNHTPEKRARADQEAYAADMNGLHAEMLELARTDEQKTLLAEEIERYRKGSLEKYTAYLHSHSRCASSMITGPANFPVRRLQKYGEWADNKRDEILNWRTRARAAIKSKLLDARPEAVKEDDRWQDLARDIKHSLDVLQPVFHARV